MDDTDLGIPQRGGPLPLIPLPNIFLIPGALLPLNVMGPRHASMIQDLLDSSGFLMLGTYIREEEDDASGGSDSAEEEFPDVEELGGLGYLESYHVLDDGRYVLLCRGLARAHVEEIDGGDDYRTAHFEVLEESPVTGPEREVLDQELREAIQERAGTYLDLSPELAIRQLADLLLMHLRLPPKQMNELFALAEVEDRARRALAEHQTRH